MCGRTIEDDGIKLVVDHRIPRDWGGSTDEANLWATCEECNQGKKDHFATIDDVLMRKLFRYESVHVRIGELLKAFDGKPVSATLIEIVGDQDDWMKRTRELRYLGWKIRVSRSKERGRTKSFYAVERWEDWPPDPTLVIRKYELDRARRNRTKE